MLLKGGEKGLKSFDTISQVSMASKRRSVILLGIRRHIGVRSGCVGRWVEGGGGGGYGAFQQCYAIRRCRLSPPHKNNLVKILSGATFTYHLTMQLVTFL